MTDPERDAPDLEDLAAYLDGRLADELKARVEERLLRDEDYYEVFTESLRFQEEQAEETGGEVVTPAVWWRSWKTMAPLAVAAALVAALGLPRLMLGPPTGELLKRLDVGAVVAAGDEWADPGWPRLRGDSRSDLEPEQRAFRIGTRTVDLQVALVAGDRAAASLAAAQLDQWADDDFLVPIGAYADLRARINGGEPDALKIQAADLEDHLAEGLEDAAGRRYALGRWNETGRLAALAGDAEVLAGIWRRRRVARGIEKIEPQLERLEDALEQPAPNFAAAAAAFSEIADALAGRG